jgi:hypothetical protein
MPLPKFEGEEYQLPEPEDTSADNDKFEVEIEDDTPQQDRGRKAAEPPEDPTDEELASYDEKVQTRIKKFTRGYHDERRAKEEAQREREAAESFAKQVFEENKKLKSQLEEGSKIFIDQSKNTAQMELDTAKKRFKQAFEVGDSDELTLAQEALAKATMRLDRAETMRPIESPEIQYEQPKPKLAPKTQRWVENNSDWWGKDEEMTMAAMGLDKKLQTQYGSDYVGTEEYFKTIDKTMRKRFPEHFSTQSSEDDEPPKRTSEPDDEDEPPRRAKPATVVASATRSTPPNRIKLLASQAAIARRLGVPIEEYAKQVAKLKRGE